MRSVPAFSASSFVLLRRLLAVFALATLAACSSTTEYDETAGWSANKLYGEAKEAQAEGSWENAVKFLEKLEARYPYGRFAQQAQLELAYVYWKAGEPGSALAAADRIQQALEHARRNLSQSLSVEDLAEAASLSQRQFSRVFTAETGQSPAKAVEGLRLEAARLMIESSRHPLEVVARETGFRDRRHMREAFMRGFGMPPQAVRREARV